MQATLRRGAVSRIDDYNDIDGWLRLLSDIKPNWLIDWLRDLLTSDSPEGYRSMGAENDEHENDGPSKCPGM